MRVSFQWGWLVGRKAGRGGVGRDARTVAVAELTATMVLVMATGPRGDGLWQPSAVRRGSNPPAIPTPTPRTYSDISNLTMASSESNRLSAKALQSSVLPTPVGPKKTRLAMGWWGG